MQTQTLIIPCELPDLNTTLSESKRHWSKYSQLKREYTALVAALARRQLRHWLAASCAPLLAGGFTYRLCGIVEIDAKTLIMSVQRKSSSSMGLSLRVS